MNAYWVQSARAYSSIFDYLTGALGYLQDFTLVTKVCIKGEKRERTISSVLVFNVLIPQVS